MRDLYFPAQPGASALTAKEDIRNIMFCNLSKDDRVIARPYTHLTDPEEIADRFDTYVMQFKMDGEPMPAGGVFGIKEATKRVKIGCC